MGTKVLLVGINGYPDMPLNGCVNDVTSIYAYLQQKHALKEDRLRLLTDAQGTRQAIIDGIGWLLEPDNDGEPSVRLFHYSGHGTFVPDENGDEPDGQDEALVPYDYKESGMLIDDVLREQYARFTPDTHLLLTMDCCHSGSIQRSVSMDRRYRFMSVSPEQDQLIRAARQKFEMEKQQYVIQELSDMRSREVPQDEWESRIKAAMSTFDKKRFGQEEVAGNVVLISGCRADQTAADARFGEGYNGALTFYMLEALRESGGRISYNGLIDKVGTSLFNNKFVQIPQLECSSASRECGFMNVAL